MPADLAGDALRRREALQAALDEATARLVVPGAAVGVYHRGREDYAFSGVTSVENPLPVDAGTLFQVGSTTKTLTATALMRLVERGLVELGAPVRRYLPELRLREESVAERVTVLQLLNHTAGWEGDFFHDTGDGDDALARYVAALESLRQLQPPGTVASYNNAALGLAGRILEKVTGATYERSARELVLDPLGLEQSFLFPAEVMTRRFAVGHRGGEGGPRVALPWRLPRSSTPAGGLVSSAGDQIRYARFHLGGDGGSEVLSTESRRRMQEPTFSFRGAAIADAVGISWLLRQIGDARLVGHGGSTNGQMSAFQMVPEHDFAVTVLTNAFAGARLHRELVAWALDHYLGVRAEPPRPLELSASQLAAYAGRYLSDTVEVTITVEGPGLRARFAPVPVAYERYRVLLGEVRHDPPCTLRLIADDGYLVMDGEGEGTRGSFLRDVSGVAGVNVGGRLALRA